MKIGSWLLTSCTSMGEGLLSWISNVWLPGKNLSSKSDGTDPSFMFPFARSMRNSAGLIARRGAQPIEEKYSISSEIFPKYKELPLSKRINSSNFLKSLLDGWWIVVTTVLPAYNTNKVNFSCNEISKFSHTGKVSVPQQCYVPSAQSEVLLLNPDRMLVHLRTKVTDWAGFHCQCIPSFSHHQKSLSQKPRQLLYLAPEITYPLFFFSNQLQSTLIYPYTWYTQLLNWVMLCIMDFRTLFSHPNHKERDSE